MTWIMRHLKRKHNALWADLSWMEPFGASTWVVHVRPHPVGNDVELARSSSMVMALWLALRVSKYEVMRRSVNAR